MHYFLSGISGVGKSTVIAAVVAALGCPVGGFCTKFDAPKGAAERQLYLMPAQPNTLPSYHVATCTPQGPATVYAKHFDDAAFVYLPEQPAAPLIIMDECGRIERHAHLFQRRVLDALAGDTPILGVLCYKPSDFTKAIAAHPNVTVLQVTPENRDALPAQMVALLKP